MIPALGKDTIVKSITSAELQHLLDTKRAKHPGAARTCLLRANVRPFFAWCVKRKIVATSPARQSIAPKTFKARDRVLSEAEIKSFWPATSLDPNPMVAFHRLLLLTAQRREEVAGMRWSELDVEKGDWTNPERAHQERQRTPDPPVASGVGYASGARAIVPSCFLSANGKTSIKGYSEAKERLDAIMQLAKPWRVHDLRRTAASGMAVSGFQPHIIERVLNHVSGAQGGLVGVYQRYEYLEDRKRAAVQAIRRSSGV